MKEEPIELMAVVTRKHQAHQYYVRLDNSEKELFAILSGKMIKNKVWMNVGDKCLVEITPYDLQRCRVKRRM